MSILVVGSIALDSVETPSGKAVDSPGGSALFFSAAASIFAPVKVVGVVGEDFDFSIIEFLHKRKVDLSGIRVEHGQTFRWGGRYQPNMNIRDTLYTHLNVFESFQPAIPTNYRRCKFVFLANIDPVLQLQVLDHMDSPSLTVLDTMNFWIAGKRQELMEVIRRVDVIILNDEEIKELTGHSQLQPAAQKLLQWGPRLLVIKKGEHGAVLVSGNDYFTAPAYPVKEVVDPTGAGDSFAGGFVGYLATCQRLTSLNFRRAVAYGSTVASFAVESFSFNRLKEVSRRQIEQRYQQFQKMTRF
jgi:sugar/nucleoside kinase (ribokinase family)